MRPSPPEQIAAARNANLDTQFALTSKVFEAFEKLVQLNLAVVKSTLAEIEGNAQQALSAKDLQGLSPWLTAPIPPLGERAWLYGRQVYNIALSTQAEFAKVAEMQYDAYRRRVHTLVDDIAHSAPTGSEAAVAVMKSAITAADTAYETLHKATQQAVEIVEGNLDAASKVTRQGVEQASRAAPK